MDAVGSDPVNPHIVEDHEEHVVRTGTHDAGGK